MADAVWAIPNFLGGEISQFAQGRFDRPDYRVSLNVCLNGFPNEIGAWVRRPGTKHAGLPRGGQSGRVIKFDFEQAAPVTLEFTDGFLRFRNGVALITTNDAQVVLAVSSANPAVVQTTSATTWSTGDTLIFPGASTPLLENRQFTATKVDTTHFSLADALTGANIDGSTLAALVAGATVARVHELVTAYTGGGWSSIRAVQAETTDILLSATIAPQALTVPTLPSAIANPVFAIGSAIFNDGPYLDPFINGVQATPSAKVGVITLTLSFPAYDSSKAYAAGAFVTSSSVNYISLVDQNVGNTPASSPSFWATTSASVAINNGQGFLGSDVGRLVRLLSEPAIWAVGTTYAAGNTVSYNPSGLPGASTYWQSLVAGNIGHAPGSDLTNWQIIPQGAAIWSWGKVTSLSNVIDRALAGSVNIGNMTGSGGLAAAFNGVFSQIETSSATAGNSGLTTPVHTVVTETSFIGKNYSGASAQKISQAIVWPSSDKGIGFGTAQFIGIGVFALNTGITLTLRGNASAPASASDGTLLGRVESISNTAGPITILSNDAATSWNYVWVQVDVNAAIPSGGGAANADSWQLQTAVAQLSLFGPPGTGVSSGVNLEILGPPLLYTNPITTWRLGVYSNTTGFPTCGAYFDGRLYLGGAVANRFDACVANGILGGTVNFAPTDQYGVVAASNAISYTFNSDGVNQIVWMKPDLQGVLMGTQAGEWLVQAPTAGSIAPTNITARNVTNHGSTNIQPCGTEHTNVFVQRFAKKLLEYFPDVYSGKFSAPNLADKAQHITRSSIAELAYVSAVTPIIWGRDLLGALFGITYKRDTLTTAQGPSFYAWHRHTLGSGRLVESVCAGPSTGGDLDSLTMVTNDSVTNIRHVEVLTDAMDEFSPLSKAWFLDDAVTPTSTSASATGLTINGLWHLNGKTVQVFAGGLDCGDPGEGKAFSDFVVTNGSCFVPYGDGISAGAGRGLFTNAFVLTGPQIVVGFTYNSDGQLVRPIAPADTGARNGPALGKTRRNHQYSMLLSNSRGLSVGGTFSKLFPVPLKLADGVTDIATTSVFSGVVHDTLSDDYSYNGMVCWRVSRPVPANIIAISGNIQTQDR